MRKEIHNKLLNRKEVELELESESNPGIAKCRADIAKHFKSEENLVVIKRLLSHFGKNNFVVEAYIYKDEANMKAVEMPAKKKKEVKQ
ncbi:MAG: hypothetical protein AABW80_04630 [Nanoarchaeota archaeon]